MSQVKIAAMTVLLSVPARALKTESIGARPFFVTSGQALLKLSSGTAPSDVDGALAALRVRRLSSLGHGWIVVGWSDPAPVPARLGALKTVPGVLTAQPSRVYSARIVPDI